MSRSASHYLSGIKSTTLHVHLSGSISLDAAYGGVSLSASFSARSTMSSTDILTDGSIRRESWNASTSFSLSRSSTGDESKQTEGSDFKDWIVVMNASPRTTSSSSYTLTISSSCSRGIIDSFSSFGYI